MSVEIINLGDFHQFDPYKMDIQNPVTEYPDISLLSTSSLTVSFQGEAKTPYNDLPDTPMQHYLKIATDAKDFLKSAQNLAIEANESIDASNIVSKEKEIQDSSSRLVKVKLQAEIAAKKLEEYDIRSNEIDEEVSVLQKQIVEKRIEGFHSKIAEFDAEIEEVQAKEEEYERIIAQDNAYIGNNTLGNLAYEEAIALEKIYTELKGDQEKMQGEFAVKLDEFKSQLQEDSSDRFFAAIQKIILGKLLGQEEIIKEDLQQEIKTLLTADLENTSKSLERLDAKSNIDSIRNEKSDFEDRGISNYTSADVRKLLQFQEEKQDEISPQERDKLQATKNSAARIASELEESIKEKQSEVAELKSTQSKLGSLNLAPALKEIDKILDKDPEILASEDVSIILADSSKAREGLVTLRNNISIALEKIELGKDEISVDIALACDLDKLFVLKNNYLKQYILDNKTIANIDKQMEQVSIAISNTGILHESILNVEKFIQETGMQKDVEDIVKAHKVELNKVKDELSERKAQLTKDYKTISTELESYSKKLKEINQNITSLRDDGSFAPYAAADDLASNYISHKMILDALNSLLFEHKNLKLEKQKEAPKAKDIVIIPDEEEDNRKEFEETYDKNNMSLADELAGLDNAETENIPKEEGSSLFAEMQAAEEKAREEIESFEEFAEGIEMTSSPKPANSTQRNAIYKTIEAKTLPITDNAVKSITKTSDAEIPNLTANSGIELYEIGKKYIDNAKNTDVASLNLDPIEGKDLLETELLNAESVINKGDSDIESSFGNVKAKEIVNSKKLSHGESLKAKMDVSNLDPVKSKMPNIRGKISAVTSFMDFSKVMDLLDPATEDVAEMQSSADSIITPNTKMQISKAKATSISKPISKIVAQSNNHVAAAQNNGLLESGTLSVDTNMMNHKMIQNNPVNKIADAPSMHDRSYEKLFKQLNSGGKITGGNKDAPIVNNAPNIPMKHHKNQDMAARALMAAAGDSKPLGGGDISLSRYSAEELSKLSGDGYRIGDRLLAALRRMLNPNLVVDITPGY